MVEMVVVVVIMVVEMAVIMVEGIWEVETSDSSDLRSPMATKLLLSSCYGGGDTGGGDF